MSQSGGNKRSSGSGGSGRPRRPSGGSSGGGSGGGSAAGRPGRKQPARPSSRSGSASTARSSSGLQRVSGTVDSVDRDPQRAAASGSAEAAPKVAPVRRRIAAPPDRLPVRLAIGLTVAVGVIAVCWLLGAIGHRLGFAMAMRVPELDTGGTRALATGVMMFVSLPQIIFEAGLRQPFWLLAGFLLISVPASSLAAAAPRKPGAPPPNPVYAAMANIGASAAMLNAIGMLWWTGSSVRTGFMRPMPMDPAAASTWPNDVATAAGLDVLAVVAASLWVVLVMRLPIATWLRALAASACYFALVVVVIAMSISAATASQVSAQRAVVVASDAPAGTVPVLLIGRAGDREAILVSTPRGLEVSLREPPPGLRVVGRASIADVARDAAGDDDGG
ncbi:MAG: hypothetical protein AB8G96_08445 [Phycisphaerales bacterium]